MSEIRLGGRLVGDVHPTYFIADISANHDGDLGRAVDLIHLAKEAGADAAKFQNFRAAKIVSDHGFRALGGRLSHQANWTKSVFDVYQAASLPWEWTQKLKDECGKAGIEYFSAPYDFDSVDMLDPFVDMYKVGSGDITWTEMLVKIAAKGKPVLLATGASDIGDVQRAVHVILAVNPSLLLMQCNTNYTGKSENFRHVHLNVLISYRVLFPELVLGLSDHTPGHATALGAVALGARVIEKHFTDDISREGPDHPFSMNPKAWREMVDRTRELEYALGDADKRVCENEQQTVVVQRRCLRAARDLAKGTLLMRDDLDVLRPAPEDGIFPYDMHKVLGRSVAFDLSKGAHLTWDMLGPPRP